MRTTTAKELRDQATRLLQGSEPFLITRRGKIAGLYLPLAETQDLPLELHKGLQASLARAVRQFLEERGVTEAEILEGFERSRK